jgi:hypothetical protein
MTSKGTYRRPNEVSSEIDKSCKEILEHIELHGWPNQPDLPEEFAWARKNLPQEDMIRLEEAWHALFQPKLKKQQRMDKKDAVKTLIVLGGATLLWWLLRSRRDASEGRRSAPSPALIRPNEEAQSDEKPEAAVLLLAASVADVDRLFPVSPKRIMNRETAEELRRITRWVWCGAEPIGEQYWSQKVQASRASVESVYDFKLIRIDLERFDDRFISPSSVVRAEAFADLSGAAIGISSRVSNEILSAIRWSIRS